MNGFFKDSMGRVWQLVTFDAMGLIEFAKQQIWPPQQVLTQRCILPHFIHPMLTTFTQMRVKTIAVNRIWHCIECYMLTTMRKLNIEIHSGLCNDFRGFVLWANNSVLYQTRYVVFAAFLNNQTHSSPSFDRLNRFHTLFIYIRIAIPQLEKQYTLKWIYLAIYSAEMQRANSAVYLLMMMDI